jgi:hypothetical protein
MYGGFLPRIDISAVNWIIRRAGIGVALIAMVVVLAIVVGFFAACHGSPLASGLIWVKQ